MNPTMNRGHVAIAAMAVQHEIEAANRLYIGDYAGCEGKLHEADRLYAQTFLWLGTAGDEWSVRR